MMKISIKSNGNNVRQAELWVKWHGSRRGPPRIRQLVGRGLEVMTGLAPRSIVG